MSSKGFVTLKIQIYASSEGTSNEGIIWNQTCQGSFNKPSMTTAMFTQISNDVTSKHDH